MTKQVINHKHYCDAEIVARRALANHRPGRLVGFCGLSGGGKTFLRNRLIREIVGPPEGWGTGKLAAVEVMSLLDLGTKFSAKGFAARSHRALLRPDLRGIYRDTEDEIQSAYLESLWAAERAWEMSRSALTTSETAYWQGFIETGIDRDLKYFLVEHATAFATVRRDETPSDHIQNLMSVMEAVGAMGVLNFVPDGYRLWEGRPEIADRMDIVYIAPYDICDPLQMTEFAKLVLAIAKNYRIESESVIREAIMQIAIGTGTSVRSVEQLFDNATSISLQNDRKCISTLDLLSAMPNKKHVESVWRQVRLLKTVSTPASTDDLLAIHQAFVESRL